MIYEIIFSPQAIDDLKRVSARNRAVLRDAFLIHLRYEPVKISKSRIKRLRGLRRPQYRLRAGDFRVFYDVDEREGLVELLAIAPKSDAAAWLADAGELE